MICPTVTAAGLFLTTAGLAGAETCRLQDQRQPGEHCQVKLTFAAEGLLRSEEVQGGSKESSDAPMVVRSQLAFQERLSAGHAARQRFELAEAHLQVGDQREQTILPDHLKEVCARRVGDEVQLVAVHGQFSRAELDLVRPAGNTLAVYGLLPGREVAVGEQWAHKPGDLAALLNLDHVGIDHTRSQLVEISRGLARMQLSGTLKGTVNGAITSLRIRGDYRYDVHWGRISWLQLAIREERDSGPANPGFVATADLRMLIQPARGLAERVPDDRQPAPADFLLRFESDRGGFRLLHDRGWHVLDDHPKRTTLRRIDKGETIAQCNIKRLPNLPAGRQLDLGQFQRDIQDALRAQFTEFEHAQVETAPSGCRDMRVVALGAVSGIPIRWIYHHVSDPQGRCATAVYTMDLQLADRFGDEDRGMIESLELLDIAADPGASGDQQAAAPTPRTASVRLQAGYADPAGPAGHELR